MEISNSESFIFKTKDGVKIYENINEENKKNIDDRKLELQKSYDIKLFTPLIPSTLTCKGYLTNVKFNEFDLIKKLKIPNGGYILKIGCNYGELINTSPDYKEPEAQRRVSNRGRKPKIKQKSTRKIQGSGRYFSSQITFTIYNTENNKKYKIKLFRNGNFQVPGIKRPDMSDLILPMKILRDYLRIEFNNNNINIDYFISVMRNCKCRLINKDILIRINELEYLFKDFKLKNKTSDSNNINIAEIQYNCERYFGLIIKFYRPIYNHPDKRTTIKILRSGKINLDGGNNTEEIEELYYWLEKFFIDNKTKILYNVNDSNITDTDYDIGSGESVYDSD